ncbi:MAG: 4-aminobutyrate aminotransferase-like enzyme, partial [Gammaproteobacteria bacterium]
AELTQRMGPGVKTSGRARFVPAPDSYRPLGGEAGLPHAHVFADAIGEQIEALSKTEHGFSALMVCPFFANEGFPNLPIGWLKPAVDKVHAAGGIVICDEVQPGFGRLGSHMWGHQKQAFAPDVVTLGKPMANGHPVGAVVTSADTMAAFRNSFRYFNTFGGNPVSCAAAMAVLDVLEEEKLMEHAKITGDYIQGKLRILKDKHACVGDVRGSGLFFGAEMVTDKKTGAPATNLTEIIVNEMRHQGVLLSSLGPARNTLKMRPPLPFTNDNADVLFDVLDSVLDKAMNSSISQQ